jgi:VWFA-related protein
MTLALLALAQLAVATPQSAIRDPQSRVVTIDVVVSDAKGKSVDTLKASDFELRDDGSLHSLDEVRFVRDDARLFAIYLDEYHVSSGAAAERVRAALTQFIDHDLGPNDQIVVMKPLDSLFKIQLTRDHAAARAIVAQFEGRKGSYEARNEYEREFIAGTPARIEATRTQVAWSALNALAVHLGTTPGRRKTLIVVGESLARMERRRGQETLPSLDAVVRAANRSNVSIYAVDPSGSDGDAAASDAVRRLASETDGQVIADDLAAGLDRASADASAYYVLTFQQAHPEDGKFHPVQVRVKRVGTQPRARSGYYSPSPDDALRAAVLARLTAPKPTTPPEPAPHASALIRPWFGWSRGDGGKTRVTFVWEPAARVPGDRSRTIASRLMFTALAGDGAVLFEGPVSPTGAGAIDEAGAVPSRVTFEAPPGRIKLRMSIQDAAAQVIDRDVRDLVVRDLRGDVAIGTPEVLRARNAREFRTLDAGAGVPVVAREFSRAEQLLVRVPIYAAAPAPPAVSARLLSRMGQTMRDLAVTPPASDGFDEIALPLAGLAVGEYMIEVVASTSSGEAKDRINFRVTP